MRTALLAALLSLTALSGCLSDADGDGSGADGEVAEDAPVSNAPFLGALSGFGDAFTVETPTSGNGIWIHNNVLYWSNGGLSTYDVTDPNNIQLLDEWGDGGSRDVDVLEWDGRTYAMLAGSAEGLHVVDATDPTNLQTVASVILPSGAVHNVASLPGTPYVYSSAGSEAARSIDVLDISDPANPVTHTFAIPLTVNGVPTTSDGCHDITVRPDIGRAYCAGGGSLYAAGGGETFIWDISEDPTNPVWISMLDDPRIIYHHQAMVNEDATLLIVDDENLGPNCFDFDVPGVGSEDQVPTGAAWIYDISDETNPVQLSYVQNPAIVDNPTNPAQANCGSHFGDMIPGQDAFVMGWYGGGTLLVDYSDPAAPVRMDSLPAASSTWDARYWHGHVYHASSDLIVTPLV